MGEFGRTPRINLTAGRDHFPKAFNVALAGCGVKGGRVIGATDKLGTEVVERPVGAGSVLYVLPGAGYRSAARKPKQCRPADQDCGGRGGGEGSFWLGLGISSAEPHSNGN